MFLSILCPTRERPDMAAGLLKSAMQDTSNDIEVLFYVASNDPMLDKYRHNLPCEMITVGPHIYTVAAWNLLYDQCSGDLIMLTGDDVVFGTPGWLSVLEERAARHIGSPHVFHFMDSRHPEGNGNPHPIVTRAWAELMGWFLPPWFRHWYVDVFTCTVAKKTGVFTKIPEVLLIHNKTKGSSSRFPWAPRWHYEDSQMWSKSERHMNEAIEKVLGWKAENEPQKL